MRLSSLLWWRSARPSWTPTLESVTDFVRCGGVLTLEEWAAMPPVLRTLFSEAADRIDAQRAALAGIASWDEASAAAVMSPADEGAWSRRIMLRAAAESGISRVRRTG